MSGLCKVPMYPTVTSFRPPSGMRCDSRLLSSFITGALTATTVTLFLLRVVPGTYVVLPCDPTITARPVLMEEYFDHIEKQEVFPDDSLIDTRPLHSHGVKEVIALHSKKSRPQKKKKKKTPQDKELSQQKLSSKANTQTTKEAVDAPKDLQQQLKDLQEKENLLKGSVWSVSVQQQPKQKNVQEQLQIKQHLEEIQLHLQKQSEEIKQKLEEEIKKKKLKGKAAEMFKEKYGSGLHLQQNSLQKHPVDKKKSESELKSQMEKNEIPVRKKRESYPKKNYAQVNSHNKTPKHQKPPDSKLLQAIIKKKSDPLGLYTSNYNKLLHHHNKENDSHQLSMQEFPATKASTGTITSVPKFSQILPLKTKASQVSP
ncbi:probable serine/threonine-protein kinase irlF [Macrobrachium rosenbergii]|uniref:probable serine/threonine-protein kinase irlF n=1 Tax=Macrobrachium rosenbergii TaxID=79674 RepID=UPI0034D3FE72